MEVSKRQIQILVQLVNEHDWITSEKIALTIGTNRKTVQVEIKSLTDLFGDLMTLKTNKRTGYLLESLAPELQLLIINEVSKHEIYSSMNFRASTITVYLLFQDTFVSMQQLADVFYLSKTAISLEVKTILRWMERNSEIDLVVSGTEGLKLVATENMKRIFCSMIGTEGVIEAARIEEPIIAAFQALLPLAKVAVKEMLLAYDYIVSGEDYLRLCRYVALTIVRSRFGWQVTSSITADLLIPMVHFLEKELLAKTDYLLTKQEETTIGAYLLELNHLNSGAHSSEELIENLRQFEQKIIEVLRLPTTTLFPEPTFLVAHIQQMETRIKAGHNILNHFAQKTSQNFPLELYLVRRYFPLYFGIRPNLAESSYLALYLASALGPYRSRYHGLIVSNQPFSVINVLKKQLIEASSHKIVEIDVAPSYLFEARNQEQKAIDVFFSTEEEIIFKDPQFFYVNSVLDTQEVNELKEVLQNKLTKLELAKKQTLIERFYRSEQQLKLTKPIEKVTDLFPHSQELIIQPMGNEKLLGCILSPEVETKISRYHLAKDIIYQQRKIKEVLVVSCNQAEPDILLFFSSVAELLEKKDSFKEN